MIDWQVLSIFIPTFFFVSLTPGMCMTLALTLGMSIGLKRTFWMMTGELVGVGLVSTLAVIGVASIVLKFPSIFVGLKVVGGLYLGFLGIQLWLEKGKMSIKSQDPKASKIPRWQLASQGFVTAIANPKGWAFSISLLPPFINMQEAIGPQLSILVAIILICELICLTAYASGGSKLRKLLLHAENVRLVNKVAGVMMLGVAAWLVLG
jgi:homoserine/homoserine lactone efflux protein